MKPAKPPDRRVIIKRDHRAASSSPCGQHRDMNVHGPGGITGALLAKPLVQRFGQRRVLLAAGLARTPWMLILPLAPSGTAGLIVIMVADTLLLASAGVFNAAFATYRMNVTRDLLLTRVLTAWSISSRLIQ